MHGLQFARKLTPKYRSDLGESRLVPCNYEALIGRRDAENMTVESRGEEGCNVHHLSLTLNVKEERQSCNIGTFL